MALSIIVSVLESDEVVRRQLIYLNEILTPSCEVILVDDGGSPRLSHICNAVAATKLKLAICVTRDARPWTQPRGRNIGARLASGDRLLFFDIDHILTHDIIASALAFQGDRFHWRRTPAILDENGELVTDPRTLRDCGWDGSDLGVHLNSFVIRRKLFESLGGYDERFCGRYGGDDIDFNQRYNYLVAQGKAASPSLIGHGYVFPNPTNDSMNLFHRLTRG